MNSILEIMTPDPITLNAEASLAEAGTIMQEKRIRHIPIVGEDNALVGLITQRDLLAAANGDKSRLSVGDVMRTSVYTIGEQDELRAAALRMQQYKIGSLPVLRNDQLVGIITDSDYVSLAINLLEQMAEIEPDEIESYDDELEELSASKNEVED